MTSEEKWGECVRATLVRVGGGLTIGVVLAFLTMSDWPVLFGAGLGFGMAADKCDQIFNHKMLFSSDNTHGSNNGSYECDDDDDDD